MGKMASLRWFVVEVDVIELLCRVRELKGSWWLRKGGRQQ